MDGDVMGGEFEFLKYHTTISYGTPVELHRRLARNETETATCIQLEELKQIRTGCLIPLLMLNPQPILSPNKAAEDVIHPLL